ncbi:transposase [Streptomyces asiaticus]|uniref:transposase n=1 Tax=Streptomyces asiaticus TaxID=114695 RepID=UPI003D70C5F6
MAEHHSACGLGPRLAADVARRQLLRAGRLTVWRPGAEHPWDVGAARLPSVLRRVGCVAAAPGAPDERAPWLCFHLKPGSYDTMTLIDVLRQVKAFYAGEPVVLVWDGLSAHWSLDMRARVAGQNWLTLERLPAYAPELNPVELLWSAIKTRELANLTGDQR